MGDTGGLQQAKLVLLGDMGAGKSSLVLRFVKGQFFDYQVRTHINELLRLTCVSCELGEVLTVIPLSPPFAISLLFRSQQLELPFSPRQCQNKM